MNVLSLRCLPPVAVLAALLYLPLSSSPAYAAGWLLPHWQYTLGRGVQLGATGFTIGGYASVQYENGPRRPHRFTASTLSSLIMWKISSRVEFLSELELEEFVIVDEKSSFHSRSDSFEIERLYTDFFVSDAFALRIGKFLTPVGRWNERHAAPLVWTTSRPLVTSRSFAENTTGGMLHGLLRSFGQDLEYAVYIAFPEDVDPDQEDGPFEEAVGARLQYPIGTIQFGASYVHFVREEEIDEDNEQELRENLFGLDFLWASNGYELSGEALYRVGNAGRESDEWGGFIQGVAPLARRLFAIGRYELFGPTGSGPGMHVWVIALAFRPLPALILKVEYDIAHRNSAKAPEGFITSISILF